MPWYGEAQVSLWGCGLDLGLGMEEKALHFSQEGSVAGNGPQGSLLSDAKEIEKVCLLSLKSAFFLSLLQETMIKVFSTQRNKNFLHFGEEKRGKVCNSLG